MNMPQGYEQAQVQGERELPELHAIAVKTGMTAEDIGKLIKDWRQV